MASLIEKTIAYVRQEMATNDSSHDWHHIDRVRRLAYKLSIDEGLNEKQRLIAELAALLHDIKDWKYSGSETAGADAARLFLENNQVDKETIDEVCLIIKNIGFSKEIGDKGCLDHPILAVVQDADRLDALGAIGIARCLTYGGAKNRILYDPDIPPRSNLTEKEYKYGVSTTINHFPEKLFKLKDMMKTKSGRCIAQHRHQLMVEYLDHFESEWEGKT
jgi:uncharacterized protein